LSKTRPGFWKEYEKRKFDHEEWTTQAGGARADPGLVVKV
jgi:hypothetical protein